MKESGDEIGKRMARQTLNNARSQHFIEHPEDNEDELPTRGIPHERSKETKPREYKCAGCKRAISKGSIYQKDGKKYCKTCFALTTGAKEHIESSENMEVIRPVGVNSASVSICFAVGEKYFRQCFNCGGIKFYIGFKGNANCCECGSEYKITGRAE